MALANWLVTKLSRVLMKESPREPSYLCDFDRITHELRPADVILIEGHSANSRVIKRLTQSSWSHAALFIGRIHDIEDVTLRELVHKSYKGPARDQLIIESILGKGTVIHPLTYYEGKHIRICRPAGLLHSDAQKVIGYAVRHIGKSYNLRHLIDLGRFLLASKFIPRRWKSTLFDYEPGQATQDICSSMIAAAFSSVNFPVLPLIREDEKQNVEFIRRNPKLFTPSDFDYSPYFNIIKYPLLPLSGSAPYRNLPWKDGLIYNDEPGIVIPKKSRKKKPDKKV